MLFFLLVFHSASSPRRPLHTNASQMKTFSVLFTFVLACDLYESTIRPTQVIFNIPCVSTKNGVLCCFLSALRFTGTT